MKYLARVTRVLEMSVTIEVTADDDIDACDMAQQLAERNPSKFDWFTDEDTFDCQEAEEKEPEEDEDDSDEEEAE